MADTKSSEERKPEEVMLTNVSKRPLLLRLPGQTLRFGPGDQQTVPKSLLATTELLRMCEQRFVVASPISEPEGEAEVASPETTTATSEETLEVSEAAENPPEVEGEAAEGAESDSEGEMAAGAESAPGVEAAAADSSESNAADLPTETPAAAATPETNLKAKKPTKSKTEPQ
jgi:hypothetical protein